MIRAASLSPDLKYRYTLHRIWDWSGSEALWIMINPSTADHEQDDATIRRVIRFSRRFGYGGFCVINLFAFRSRHRKDLRSADDPVGPDNLKVIERSLKENESGVWMAWGALEPWMLPHSRKVCEIIKAHAPICWALGLTKHGQPRHPLYVPAAIEPLIRRPD